MARPAQVTAARDGGLVAFRHGREAAFRRLAAGGTVVSHGPRADFDGEPVRSFVAHATVTGEAPTEVTCVEGVRHRGGAFRRGKLSIAPEDHERIARAMGLRAG